MIGYNRTNRNIRDRIIFLGSEIDSDFANLILAQLLFLEAEDPAKDIYMYISCSGGSVSEGMVIFDTMKLIKPDVYTVCAGVAIGMGAFLLSAGTKGKRMSFPRSYIKICKPEARQGQLTDTERKRVFEKSERGIKLR